jgi:iron complex outermembrane recepter protein
MGAIVKLMNLARQGRGVAVVLLGVLGTGGAFAQTQTSTEPVAMTDVVVTGSRIVQRGAQAEQPISIIDRDAIEKTGIASVGDLLQQLTTGGKALNAKFNSSGNFGYPPDGGGIGAGSAQVDLRNLDSKRVLVLVDGIRWVNESSASGVSGSADLNTIPMSIIDRIEVLEDGASAVYGSDAIAGVVNIITRKKFNGAEANYYTGEYGKGGRTTEASLTLGGSTEKFSSIFVASFYNQDAISSSKWWQSDYPEPLAGNRAGSSATPQGRFTFCDPSVAVPNYGSCTADQGNFYDVTLNNGTTTPVWNSANPVGPGSTYHNWSTADRFDFAPYNLLLTPSQRKSVFTNTTYDISDDVQLYLKGLYNTRSSVNQAAPEPIFVGPYTGCSCIADTISISKLNPYNPFGIDLNSATNFGWVTRRPLEGGPRVFDQDVNTWYLNAGLKGTLHFGGGFKWDINFVDTQNKASQTFYNGYNLAHLSLALGDPTICAAVPGCTPLDLFGGQGRPITPAMLNWIRATQLDSSSQGLKLISANITGDLFHIEDRAAGIALGAEHRLYDGRFDPDPLRQNGESQDSLAFPVAASYHVDEVYSEFSFPVLKTLGISAALRYSDYSTFGNETTYKGGFRWQPIKDLALRGTYSTGFRAPNIGELYGLTQFGATLVDPCGPPSGPVVPLPAGCVAQGVSPGFVQANTQITTFTGGNAHLSPEKSNSYTVGAVYNAGWAQGGATDKLNFELTYYNHKVKGAIQAQDLQGLLNACIASGGVDPTLCSGFTRAPGGNLNPPKNFLANLGEITTDGEDLKINWLLRASSIGRFSAAAQLTMVNSYKAVDASGNVAQRQVGIEVSDSAIPRLRANAQLGWGLRDIEVSWILRYLDSVKEACANASITDVPGCSNGETWHTLGAVLYHDVQVEWSDALHTKGLKLALGVNNLFGQNPPICYTCSLNGYDAGTYDLPGAFWNLRVKYTF